MAYYAFANLDDGDLSAIKSLEDKIGRPLVAMKPVDLKPAEIDADTVDAVKSLESKLGVTLVAVSP
jgi:hypothetical protein